jgi:hypothetical protein
MYLEIIQRIMNDDFSRIEFFILAFLIYFFQYSKKNGRMIRNIDKYRK